MIAHFLKQQIKLNCAGRVGNRLVYGEGLALDLAKRWTHSTMLIEHQHCLLGNSNQAARSKEQGAGSREQAKSQEIPRQTHNVLQLSGKRQVRSSD